MRDLQRRGSPSSSPAPAGTILVVSPVLPWPALAGKHIDIAGHVAFFQSEGWRVVVVVHRELSSELQERIRTETLPAETHLVARSGRYVPSSDEAVAELQSLVDDLQPDVVWCGCTDTVLLGAAVDRHRAELWCRPHNFELGQHFEKARSGFRWTAWNRWTALPTWLPSRTGRRIHAAEQAMFRCAGRMFFISRRDMDIMSRLYGTRDGMFWLPPSLHPARIPVKPTKQTLDVVYVANNYTSPTQLEGARRLLDDIVPSVEKSAPGRFRFHLVGSGSEKIGEEVATESVVAHGFVDDLEALLQEMDMSCIPVDIGWGLKIKMVEALASGLPVLGDPVVFQGLPDVTGAYAPCTSADDYARALLALSEPDERRRMADAGAAAYGGWQRESEGQLRSELARARKHAS
ncbi:MAG: glycosyltransferase family 4 protein [Candidatus Binatia bacterium]|nr:glycosyltransferase family 4 protein [Candidatus Binatia bacterium]